MRGLVIGHTCVIIASMQISAAAVEGSRICSVSTQSGPTVHLEYASYEGHYNDTYDLNVWKGIRYAAPPIGTLRWQAPQLPLTVGSEIVQAVEQPPVCPQSGAFGTPKKYGFNSMLGNEDCLYLNVYASPQASNLPVLVWIHGGGYQLFGAMYDPSVWMNTNSNGFITVEIQYRLGAFGFLSSKAVKSKGKLNSGLLDQRFALEWVRKYISNFGGDPTRVTIAGESSGAGSVLHHALSFGGRDSKLFDNMIAASPYLPPIHRYSESIPKLNYNAFVKLAGCGKESERSRSYSDTFDCLVDTESEILQRASSIVSTTRGSFGSFSWVPMIDDNFIEYHPTLQLLRGQVGGKKLLVGTNANEGVPLTNPSVQTRSDYDDFIAHTFPLFNDDDVDLLNTIYRITEAQPGDNTTRFDTLGNEGPTALTQSSYATGLQQTVFDIAAESIFTCPAQWLAEAYSTGSRIAWKYQYSVNPSHHGADLSAYFAVEAKVPNSDFRHAFQRIWGNFIMHDNPLISKADATASLTNATIPITQGKVEWPKYSLQNPQLLNLNTTGGHINLINVTDELSYYVRVGPGIANHFTLANDWTWEGGRGHRCAFWRAISPKIPR
ncbi:hypothetical protein G7046_g203 [Stylonectria norvegica]|nr:hypothetical protein G7046_g203 [Stylonectria norvegica]